MTKREIRSPEGFSDGQVNTHSCDYIQTVQGTFPWMGGRGTESEEDNVLNDMEGRDHLQEERGDLTEDHFVLVHD